jgi:hypothetical protein
MNSSPRVREVQLLSVDTQLNALRNSAPCCRVCKVRPEKELWSWPSDTQVNESLYSFIFSFEVLKAVTTKVRVVLSATPVLFHGHVPIVKRKLLSSLSRYENGDKHYVVTSMEIQRYVVTSNGDTTLCGDIKWRYNTMWWHQMEIQRYVVTSNGDTTLCSDIKWRYNTM